MKDNHEHRLPKAATKIGLQASVKTGWKETTKALQKWFSGGTHDENSSRQIGIGPKFSETRPAGPETAQGDPEKAMPTGSK